MRTRQQCLDMAANCEGLARQSSSPANRQALLETASLWRNLARFAQPARSYQPCPMSEAEEEALAEMLSDVGSLCR